MRIDILLAVLSASLEGKTIILYQLGIRWTVWRTRCTVLPDVDGVHLPNYGWLDAPLFSLSRDSGVTSYHMAPSAL